MQIVHEWAARHGVSAAALAELVTLLAQASALPLEGIEGSEELTQATLRLAAPRMGLTLWRNNVGALPGPSGVPVRYGLANDSRRLNKHIKSSDLIGIGPGGRFVAIECKRAAWVWRGTPREVAQRRFITLVRAAGGYAGFARSVEEMREVLR